MLVFRLICALLMAWAANWALGRPEAKELIETIPEMDRFGPIAAATIGYFVLAIRQGWGPIVAVANGIFAGILSIALSGVFFLGVTAIQGMRENTLQDADDFGRMISEEMGPMIDMVANVPLLVVSLGAMAAVGAITEFFHWVLVRMRGRNTESNNAS